MRSEGAEVPLGVHLERLRNPIERALERAVETLERELPADVAAAVRHGVLGGGKRIRPVLCMSAYEAIGGEATEVAYDLSAAPELIHAYSLMHDDLPCMDDADLRRGRATTHREHGEDATVRAGAAMIPAAARQALRASEAIGCPPARARLIAATLMEAAGAGGMVGGQWLDLLGEGKALGETELTGLHRRKTGALLTASLVVGALAAGASETAIQSLRFYGRGIGLAFQITDDVLDATQSAETLGKNPSDAELEKSTYVSLYGLKRARSIAQEESERAVAALEDAAIEAPALAALARYIVERER